LISRAGCRTASQRRLLWQWAGSWRGEPHLNHWGKFHTVCLVLNQSSHFLSPTCVVATFFFVLANKMILLQESVVATFVTTVSCTIWYSDWNCSSSSMSPERFKFNMVCCLHWCAGRGARTGAAVNNQAKDV